MQNNVYYEKNTGEKVSILNEDTNFYELDNRVRIKKDIFAKKYETREEVDPNSFFQKPSADPLLNLANQIKNIDTSKVADSSDGTRIKYTPPLTISDNSMSQQKVKEQQREEIIQLSPDQRKIMLEEWRRTQPGAQIPEIQERNWDEDDEKFLHGDKPIEIKQKQETKVDPMEMMFKMFKNNFPVKFNIEIEENIPNPQFIEMVQENVDADAIEYYANKILDKILKEPSILKNEIYNQLKEAINKPAIKSKNAKTTKTTTKTTTKK